MKKTIRLFAITSLLAVALCSCGNDGAVEQKKETNSNEKTPPVSQVHFTEEPTTEPEVLIEVNPFEGWEITGEFYRQKYSGGGTHIDGQSISRAFYKSDVYEFLKDHGIDADIDYYTLDGKLCAITRLPENETLVAKIGTSSTDELKAEGYTDIAETTPEAEGWENLTEEDFLDYAKKRGIIFTTITSPEIVVKVTNDVE